MKKKEINETLRTMDKTKIYRMVHVINGGKPTWHEVWSFILQNAPTKKISDSSFDLVYPKKHTQEWEHKNFNDFNAENEKFVAVNWLKRFLKDVNSPYTKRPMLGHTHLWFCSPVYGHRDYNKFVAMKIEGNEKFCETIVKLADKYFPKYDTL